MLTKVLQIFQSNFEYRHNYRILFTIKLSIEYTSFCGRYQVYSQRYHPNLRGLVNLGDIFGEKVYIIIRLISPTKLVSARDREKICFVSDIFSWNRDCA